MTKKRLTLLFGARIEVKFFEIADFYAHLTPNDLNTSNRVVVILSTTRKCMSRMQNRKMKSFILSSVYLTAPSSAALSHNPALFMWTLGTHIDRTVICGYWCSSGKHGRPQSLGYCAYRARKQNLTQFTIF